MKAIRHVFLVAICCAPAAFCTTMNVGDVFYVGNENGTTQFYLDNLSGMTDGCSTPGGFPVCTGLTISGTLTYSYLNGQTPVNGTATLLTPIDTDAANGGFSYAPSNFVLPSLNILSASFLGTLTPTSFSTDLGPFNSNGIVVAADIVAGGAEFALLTTSSASISAVPEPWSLAMLLSGGFCFAVNSRLRRLKRS